LTFDIKELNMPIYEYRCKKCGEVFERFMKVNEKGGSLTCPYCGGRKAEKVLSSFSSSKGSESASSCGPTGGGTRFT
jgi:putative FmdB family regulatory protein